jgi:hypothetical protein
MKIKNAIQFFENALVESSQKGEMKVYGDFLRILKGLDNRDFSSNELLSIEIELDLLQLNSDPRNRKRFFKKALNAFETYLNDSYSLIAKGYYSGLGVSLGSTFGMLFGLIVLSGLERSMGIVIGVIGGMVLGTAIGRNMDAKALKEGRAL